jgi:hypothetical protein
VASALVPPDFVLNHDTVDTDSPVASIWRQQSLWSLTADRLKQQISRARFTALLITIGVAVFGALSAVLAHTSPEASRATAGLAGAGAVLLAILRPRWSGRALHNWTKARAASEAMKSEIYLWLARVGRYAVDTEGEVLGRSAAAISRDADDLLRYQDGIAADIRPLPAVTDALSYFSVRVHDQIEFYYRPRAARTQKSLRRFRRLQTALALTAALSAIAAALNATAFAPWIAVVTTVSAALAVHVTATRYEYQLVAFLRAASRLTDLSRQVAAAAPAELPKLVEDAETIIKAENDGWMVRMTENPPNQVGRQP